jgi:acetyl-CoA carboxylase biotin carboxylase subunit
MPVTKILIANRGEIAIRVIRTCREMGIPTVAFLSENAGAARAFAAAGITFIGPRPESIESMGSKTAARIVAIEAGCPVVPGIQETMADEELLAASRKIGFPVMLKAAMGGGGKGMRLVHSAEEFTASLARARGEALSSFGDDSVYVEKAIVQPRHIEIQIFGDTHGNHVYLHERECR